jgi:hypothetical protein
LKEEALDRTMWRNRFGRGFGPVVRQNTEWMNNYTFSSTVVQYTKIPWLTCLRRAICVGQMDLHGVLARGVLKHWENRASSYRSGCGMVWNIVFGCTVHWSLSLLLGSVSLQTESSSTVSKCIFCCILV